LEDSESYENNDGSETESEFDWFCWNENSCRYDSFITVFTLGLYKKYNNFNIPNIDRRNKFNNQYISLCNLAEKMPSNISSKLIMDFWDEMWRTGVDDKKPGTMGYVQELLNLMLPLFDLQPFIELEKNCDYCKLETKEKVRYPLPLQIHEFGELKYNSIQNYFDWILEKIGDHCEICFEKKLNSIFNIHKDPDFIFIEFIPIQNSKQKSKIQYDATLFNKKNNSKFQLIATINNSTPLHFNCSIFEPRNIFNRQSILLEGWYLHDGVQNNGRLVKLESVKEIWKEKPMR